MNQYKLGTIIKQNFLIEFYGLLYHVIEKLVLNHNNCKLLLPACKSMLHISCIEIKYMHKVQL